jgi:hypothetical protein
MSLLVGERWIDAPVGTFVLVPGGITHGFENRSNARAGVLNFPPISCSASSRVAFLNVGR